MIIKNVVNEKNKKEIIKEEFVRKLRFQLVRGHSL